MATRDTFSDEELAQLRGFPDLSSIGADSVFHAAFN